MTAVTATLTAAVRTVRGWLDQARGIGAGAVEQLAALPGGVTEADQADAEARLAAALLRDLAAVRVDGRVPA